MGVLESVLARKCTIWSKRSFETEVLWYKMLLFLEKLDLFKAIKSKDNLVAGGFDVMSMLGWASQLKLGNSFIHG